MKTKTIKLSDIVIDEDTQQRESIDLAMVAEYAESIQCGSKFPPVTVFFDSAQYWLADGYHRYYAHKDSGIPEIYADIHDGTKDDAVMFSFGANGTHGKRLTNADKHKNVKRALSFHKTKELSDRDIAKVCKVTHPFVSKIRKEVVTVTTDESRNNLAKISESPLEPSPVLEAEISEHEEFDPKEHELQEAHDTINQLAEENNKLRDSLAAGQLPEDEIVSAEQTMINLRKQVKNLEAELDAVKSSRDIYQRENEELKKQCKMYENKFKKIGAGNAKS